MTASSTRKTIGLCMIVKNEAHVIERCLDSVRPLVDYVLIEDTGSTDGTQQRIADWLGRTGLPGAVIEEPWRDFAYNRSHALAALRAVDSVDYALIIDADDTLEIDSVTDVGVLKAGLDRDCYSVDVRHGSMRHGRPQLCSNRLPFNFRGAIHEFLDCAAPFTRGHLAGVSIRIVGGGGRSRDPERYRRDAELLERVLAAEQDDFLRSRYTFYLAQSYRDCGERAKAIDAYLRRSAMGHWNEEVYVSLLCAARLMEETGYDLEAVLATYQKATDLVPQRAEAIHGASRFCRSKGENRRGFEIARPAIDLPVPGGLFIEEWIYQYGLLDEYAINAYWAGEYGPSLDASLRLIQGGKLPSSMLERVAANARFAADKLKPPPAPNLGAFGREGLIEQHKLVPARTLQSRLDQPPTVLLAILAKQKEHALPLYLDCIEALDYPKAQISLHIRTNNNTDRTEELLRAWLARVGPLYRSVELDASDVGERVEQYREHEWNEVRFRVLGEIRNASMRRALALDCAFYFVADIDNFIRPCTLRELVALNLPVVGPLLRSIKPGAYYSNYHAEIDANGYYAGCDQYHWILSRYVRGIVEVPVIHCTYLVRADVIPALSYQDESRRHEYVVFSDSARRAAIPQYVDNRQVYGYITFGEDDAHQYLSGGIDRARTLLAAGEAAGAPPGSATRPLHLPAPPPPERLRLG
jgi:glycosyltransferase involved in cell wall biosynthesis